jgi:RNAse (barnase) inhibitor barstar
MSDLYHDQLLNNIFGSTANILLVDQTIAENHGLLIKNDSDLKCKKVFISGKQSHTMANMMEAFYNKLQFPSHFGRNWSALNDSFKERLWDDEDNYERYLLVFEDADDLLSEGNKNDLQDLMETLKDALEEVYDAETSMSIKIVFCHHESTTNRFDQFELEQIKSVQN